MLRVVIHAANRRAFLSANGVQSVMADLLPRQAPRREQHVSIARRAMACEFSVVLGAGCRRAVDAGCAALDEIDRVEAKLSAYRDDSDISCLNRQAFEREAAVDEEVLSLFTLAASITSATGGAFDITAGALTKVWGFFAGPRRVPAIPELEAARAASGIRHVHFDAARRTVRYLRPGLEINLGAIGKGWAIDRATDLLRTRFSVSSALFEGGRSSVRALGCPPGEPRGWKVAIGDPFRPGRVLGALRLRDRALGTSGSAHQFFTQDGRSYGHVLDPRTGWPADELASASAIAPTAAEADALSTAFFVLGVAGTRRYCRKHPGMGAVLVTKPGPNPAQVTVVGDIRMERI
jgi:thiamine biosynthesis lipoprotein